MVKLHFRTTEEFDGVFKRKTREITDAMVEGIRDAMQANKDKAHIFQITFDDVDLLYEISLPKSQWKQALQSCLDHYHELEDADSCIDTWSLLELVKNW